MYVDSESQGSNQLTRLQITNALPYPRASLFQRTKSTRSGSITLQLGQSD